jgi:hypothetical protein
MNRRESSNFFMRNAAATAASDPDPDSFFLQQEARSQQEARARESSLQRRNEQLAIEIGVLIAKNSRLQSIIRKMQREEFVIKSDAATQTEDHKKVLMYGSM